MNDNILNISSGAKYRAELRSKGLCTDCKKPTDRIGKSMCSKCWDWRVARQTLRRNEARDEMIDEFGGKCVCCGEWHKEFLALDHINDNGKEDRKLTGGGGHHFYLWLKRHGWPKEGLQLLCHNCNMSKKILGKCAHTILLEATN